MNREFLYGPVVVHAHRVHFAQALCVAGSSLTLEELIVEKNGEEFAQTYRHASTNLLGH